MLEPVPAVSPPHTRRGPPCSPSTSAAHFGAPEVSLGDAYSDFLTRCVGIAAYPTRDLPRLVRAMSRVE